MSKKEEGSSIYYNMVELWGHDAKRNNTATEGQILNEISRQVKFIETGRRMGVASVWATENLDVAV